MQPEAQVLYLLGESLSAEIRQLEEALLKRRIQQTGLTKPMIGEPVPFYIETQGLWALKGVIDTLLE